MTNTKAATKRQDPHCPTNFVPEHYSFLEVIDLYAGTDRDDVRALAVHTSAPHAWERAATAAIHARANYQALAIGERPSLAQCSICGHHIRYAVVAEYRPEDSSEGIVTFGVDCAEKVEMLNLTDLKAKVGAIMEFSARMRAAVRDAEAAHREAAPPAVPVDVVAFLEDHARRHADMPEDCLLCSFALQLDEKGRLSTRQIEIARERAARAEAVDPETGPGVTVVGSIISVKPTGDAKLFALVGVDERRVGPRRVRAHRVYFPVTKVLPRGTRVRFVADLTASSSDPTFLIGRNPREQSLVQ